MTINRFDQRVLYEAHLHSCFAAVRDGFPHLSVSEIIDPPPGWFDAALARQIVIHLMVVELRWPKRRVVESEGRSREAVNRALRVVNSRLVSLRFDAHYRVIARRARGLISFQFNEQEAVA